jgi:hypothetical protein
MVSIVIAVVLIIVGALIAEGLDRNAEPSGPSAGHG